VGGSLAKLARQNTVQGKLHCAMDVHQEDVLALLELRSVRITRA